MATKKMKKPARKEAWNIFDRTNYWIFFGGALVLVLGFFSLMQGPADSFLSLRLAPVLLVVGYCVLIPLAILKRPKQQKSE